MISIHVNTKDCCHQKDHEHPRPQGERNRDHTDSFTKYSDDATRLKKLLLKEQDEEFDLEDFVSTHYETDKVNLNRTNSASHMDDCNPQDASFTRKTRITFEVHPSLLYDDSELHDTPSDEGFDSLDDFLDDDDDSDFESLVAILGLANSKE